MTKSRIITGIVFLALFILGVLFWNSGNDTTHSPSGTYQGYVPPQP